MSSTKRYTTIDFIRGLTVISMVIYHFFYDLKYIFNVDLSFYSIPKCYIWQQSICMTFIIIAGISLNFNSKKINHGVKLLFTALLITGVTYVFLRDFVIYFGIIHFLAIGILIICLLEKPLQKMHNLFGFSLNLFLFIFLRSSIYLNSPFHKTLYESISKFKFGFIIGFPSQNFTSADYFPILPWIFLLITGFYAGKIIKFDSLLKVSPSNFIVIIGQKSLEIYLLHQIVIYVVLKLLLK